MKTRLIAAGVTAALLATAPAVAQERQPALAGQAAPTALTEKVAIEALQPAMAASVRVPIERTLVKGAPYSAEVVIESVQNLADGNRITRKTTGRVYRDSQGRTRREDDVQGRAARVSVSDPVAGTAFSLDPDAKIAWKTSMKTAVGLTAKMAIGMPPPPPPAPADPADLALRAAVEKEVAEAYAASAGGGARTASATPVRSILRSPEWDEKTEKLAPRNIEGVMAEGTRITRTIPAGAIGNEQPIVSVTEEWRSPELQILVLTRTSDPRSGESTYRLLNITRAEPNQSWFEVPADYTVRSSGVARLLLDRK